MKNKDLSPIQNASIFQNLPTGWSAANFLDLVKDYTGGNTKFKSSDYLDSGCLPIVDQGKNDIAGYINDSDHKYKGPLPVVIFGDHTCILKYVDFDFALGADGVKVLAPKKPDQLMSKFLYYFLQTIEIPRTGYNRHFKYLKNLQIPLPPLPEQKAIAAQLDRADKVRQALAQSLADYDRLLAASFLDMFGDPVLNPKGWEVVKWETVLEIKSGRSHKKVNNPEGKYPIYGSGGIMGYADEYLCEGGCIVLGRKGSINKPIHVREQFWNVDTAFGLAPKSNLKSDYLYYFCHFYNFMRHNRATTLPSLVKSDLLKIDIPLPPLPLQQQFAQLVDRIERQKALIRSAQQSAEDLFGALLQAYFYEGK